MAHPSPLAPWQVHCALRSGCQLKQRLLPAHGQCQKLSLVYSKEAIGGQQGKQTILVPACQCPSRSVQFISRCKSRSGACVALGYSCCLLAVSCYEAAWSQQLRASIMCAAGAGIKQRLTARVLHKKQKVVLTQRHSDSRSKIAASQLSMGRLQHTAAAMLHEMQLTSNPKGCILNRVLLMDKQGLPCQQNSCRLQCLLQLM